MCESKELQISVSPRKSTRLSDKKKALERPGIFNRFSKRYANCKGLDKSFKTY